MRLQLINHYCGGTILCGLWGEEQLSGKRPVDWVDNALSNTPVQPNSVDQYNGYMPDDPLLRRQILKALIRKVYANYLGVIIAITNPNQEKARVFLKEMGFVSQGKYAKPGGNTCEIWHGDYRNVIKPILDKVPDYVKASDAKSKSKF